MLLFPFIVRKGEMILNRIQIFLSRFNKSNYIKVYNFKKDKSIELTFYKSKKFTPSFLLNSDHIFYSNGYRSVITSETVVESINPLNSKSVYSVEDFNIAIKTKVFKDVFSSLTPKKMDVTTILLFAIALMCAALLYFQFRG
jgi:hypothetical protein